MQSLGIWGLMAAGVKFLAERATFGIADPDLAIHSESFYGATMMIKGSCSVLCCRMNTKHQPSRTAFYAKVPILGTS